MYEGSIIMKKNRALFITVILVFSVIGNSVVAASADYLIWTENTSNLEGSIWRSNADGSEASRIISCLDIHCVVADLAAEKLYWSVDTCDSSPGYIARANLDGSSSEVLIDDLGSVRDMELDLGGGRVYWVDNETNAVSRADLDGSNVEGPGHRAD